MWTEQTIALGDGRSLHVRQAGDGPDLILIHGALTTGHDWETTGVAAIARDCRVTIVDRPGHGRSRRPRLEGTPRDQARQILDGLEALGVERPLVVAHSYGGLIALAMAEAVPAGLEGLVLAAPICFPEPRPMEHLLLAPRSLPVVGPLLSQLGDATGFDRAMLELVQRAMFDPAPVPAAWKASFPWNAVLDPQALVFEGEDAASVLPLSAAASVDLRRISLPVQVLTGAVDRVVEHERQGKALARLLPQARLVEIEGAGHMLHHTHPAALRDAIRDLTAAPAAA
jgi:pimeloyl-ACP methyl ester carboxylesterase